MYVLGEVIDFAMHFQENAYHFTRPLCLLSIMTIPIVFSMKLTTIDNKHEVILWGGGTCTHEFCNCYHQQHSFLLG